MKILPRTSEKGWGNRVNFLDDNDVFVGYEYESDCCENFGYFFTTEQPTECVPEEKLLELISKEINEDSFDFSNFIFDTTSFVEIYQKEFDDDDDGDRGGKYVSFALVNETTKERIFLILYNYHNGYYFHGFDMKENNNIIVEGKL